MEPFSIELLGSLIDSVTEGILVCSDESKIIYVNKAVENLFGYSSESLLGQNLFVLIPERYRPKHNLYVADFFKQP
ncbi:MAG TPA: PAS domain S-box protein, partial [Saprospiraceae bacterium]|nr:PAS domain S-box protein [Saprospiraceae bacterium]